MSSNSTDAQIIEWQNSISDSSDINLNVGIVSQVITRLQKSNNKDTLELITDALSEEDEIMLEDSIVKLLVNFDTDYYLDYYINNVMSPDNIRFVGARLYYINFDLLCDILKSTNCEKVIHLYNINHFETVNCFLEKYNEQEIYKLVEINPKILAELSLDIMIEESDKFIYNCMKKNPNNIKNIKLLFENQKLYINVQRIKHDVKQKYCDGIYWNISNVKECTGQECDLEKLVLESTFIVQFIPQTNIFFSFDFTQLSSDINRKIYSYLI